MKALVPRRLWVPMLGALFASLVWAGTADAYIYWAGGARIGRANNDGTGVEPQFMHVEAFTCGVAVDASHIYWGEVGGAVGRANLDGTDADNEFIKVPGGSVCGVAVTPTYIYWTDQHGHVGRANLDGTGIDTEWAVGATNACGIATSGDSVFVDVQPGESFELLELDGASAKGAITADLPVGEGRCGVAADDSHVYWSHKTSSSSDELQVGWADVGGLMLPDGSYFSTGTPSPSVLTSVAVHGEWVYYGPYNGPIGRVPVERTSLPEPSFIPSGTLGDDEMLGIAVDDLPLPAPPIEPTGSGGGSGGSDPSPGGSTTPPPATATPVGAPTKPKPHACRKGTHRKVVKGKAKCVKVHKHKRRHHSR